MIKGIIRNIELGSNKCLVELPTFNATAEACIMVPPGACNGYSEGDVVFVGFELNKLAKPVILGKLYTGTTKETDDKGAILCNSLSVSNNATLPGNTALVFKDDLLNNYSKYKTITDIIDAINTSTNKIDLSDNNSKLNTANQPLSIQYCRPNHKKVKSGDLDNRMTLKILLHGLTEDDIGKCIYLLKTKRRGKTVKYNHPANLKIKTDGGSSMGMGYATVANSKTGQTGSIFPAVPTWMPNNGLIQTEWILTADDINKGYIEIDIRHDWISLLAPSIETGITYWNKILGCGKNGIINRGRGAMKIKFALKSPAATSYEYVTNETFYFGLRNKSEVASDRYAAPESSGDRYYFKNGTIYATIK